MTSMHTPSANPDSAEGHYSEALTGLRPAQIERLRIGHLYLRVARWPGTPHQPPLLLFNDLGDNFELLAPFIDALCDQEVVTFDAPGIGGSSDAPRPYRLPAIARLAGHVLKRLGHERADVLGVGWGGAVAQEFAYRHASRCRRLVLCATLAGPPLLSLGSRRVLLQLLSARHHLDHHQMESQAGRLYGGRFRVDPGLVHEVAARQRPPSRSGYRLQLLALAGWTSLTYVWRLRQPTLVIAGIDDPILPPINAHLLARLIPESRLRLIDEGHRFLVAKPHTAAREVLEFLTDESWL